jgi:hypothetical protein
VNLLVRRSSKRHQFHFRGEVRPSGRLGGLILATKFCVLLGRNESFYAFHKGRVRELVDARLAARTSSEPLTGRTAVETFWGAYGAYGTRGGSVSHARPFGRRSQSRRLVRPG